MGERRAAGGNPTYPWRVLRAFLSLEPGLEEERQQRVWGAERAPTDGLSMRADGRPLSRGL